MKTVGIVGAYGFIGGHLSSRYLNVRKYGRDNISELSRDNSDLIVIAAAPAKKWIANSNPEADLLNIQNLVNSVKCIGDKPCVLISTIDVFPVGELFDEAAELPLVHPEGYGTNRGHLEKELSKHLSNLRIIRLPGMYGPGLKKNLIFDLKHGKNAPIINPLSKFQFYDVRSLPGHIALLLENEFKILNLATEPILVEEIYNFCFNSIAPDNEVTRFQYRMTTKYASQLAGRDGLYLFSKAEILAGIQQWLLSSSS